MKQVKQIIYSICLSFVALSADMISVKSNYGKTAFRVGIQLADLKYTEYEKDGNISNQEKSGLFQNQGVFASFKYPIYAKYNFEQYINANTHLLWGRQHYTGALQDGTPYKMSGITIIFNGKLLHWLSFQKSFFGIGIGAGGGYRIWTRNNSADKAGYLEEYQWPYGQIAGSMSFQIKEDLNIGLYASYFDAIKPQMTAYLSNTKDIKRNFLFDLGGASGYEIKVPLELKLQKDMSLNLQYIYETFDIKESNFLPGKDGKKYNEPNSKTKNSYVLGGFTFIF